MKNRKELVLALEGMRKEYIEALGKGNRKLTSTMAKNILELELALQEEEVRKSMQEISEKVNSKIEFDIIEEEVIRQDELVEEFNEKLRTIIKEKHNTSDKIVSENQANTIMAGMRDRVGMDITEKQIAFIKKLNFNQASAIIKLLRGISFYNQRVQITEAVKELRNNKEYADVIVEVRNNIAKKEWFDVHNDVLNISRELQPPTDAQVRKIADVARYIETHQTLKSDFGIDVNDFEERQEGKLYYTFNWNALKVVIKERFNKESASNFIQTYDYITNIYEGNNLDKDQMNHLRGLYMQLGEYECTKMTYLVTITKRYYDIVSQELESRVRYNKIANNVKDSRIAEAMGRTELVKQSAKSRSREVRSISVKKEQIEARELYGFVFGLYSCIGQEVPEEMSRILPYFVERGEVAYAGVEEQHYREFRRLVFEQREVIKSVDPEYNWALMIASQPTHILKVLGLDMMM